MPGVQLLPEPSTPGIRPPLRGEPFRRTGSDQTQTPVPAKACPRCGRRPGRVDRRRRRRRSRSAGPPDRTTTGTWGRLHVAKRPPFKDPISDLAKYLENEARSGGVEIDLNREFRPEIMAEGNRTKSSWRRAPCRWFRIAFREDNRVVTAESILRLDEIAPGRYLVVGGGLVGLETAEYLADHGADVTVAEMLDNAGAGLGPIRLMLVLDRLAKAGVNILTGARVTSVQDGLVRLEMAGGEITLGPYRFVVLAADTVPTPPGAGGSGRSQGAGYRGRAHSPFHSRGDHGRARRRNGYGGLTWRMPQTSAKRDGAWGIYGSCSPEYQESPTGDGWGIAR